ncbi:MAG TPA: AAA family ATPase [Candidatus Saccharimonadales bacterium]|nr:AAA family ATPase [Candidatus Saccharimonadales bacterium]
MKLTKLFILNYKSAKNVQLELKDGQPVTMIGANDCGKSTILNGMRLFFDENSKVYFDGDSTKKRTLSNTPLTEEEFTSVFTDIGIPEPDAYDRTQVCLVAEFVIDKDYKDDELDKLSRHAQFLLSDKAIGDKLYVMRVITSTGAKDEYFALTEDSLDKEGQPLALWLKTAADLTAIQKAKGIDNASILNRNNTGKPTNTERVQAIYSSDTTQPTWARFDYKKDRILFPEYRYLDWNITTDELNQLTADVISPIVKAALEEIINDVTTKKEAINAKANTSLESIFEKYKASLPASLSGLSTNVDIKVNHAVTELFVNKTTSDKAIHIDEQGDGIRRQIWFGLIKARADEAIKEDGEKRYIWCFDEPETHLYPVAQRELAEILSSMAANSFQIVVSTHSTLFVDRTALRDINKVSLQDGYTVIESTNSTEDIFDSLGVRNSDFLFYDKFIAVEGPTEYGIFDYFYKLVYGHSMLSDGIQLLNLRSKDNSGNFEQLVNDIFKDFRKLDANVVYVFDRDSGKSESNKVFLLGAISDFEDELPNGIWIQILKDICGVSITGTEIDAMRANIDVSTASTKLHKQLGDFVAADNQDQTRINFLPRKGDELAGVLQAVITDKSDIPETIKKIFEKVREK